MITLLRHRHVPKHAPVLLSRLHLNPNNILYGIVETNLLRTSGLLLLFASRFRKFSVLPMATSYFTKKGWLVSLKKEGSPWFTKKGLFPLRFVMLLVPHPPSCPRTATVHITVQWFIHRNPLHCLCFRWLHISIIVSLNRGWSDFAP